MLGGGVQNQLHHWKDEARPDGTYCLHSLMLQQTIQIRFHFTLSSQQSVYSLYLPLKMHASWNPDRINNKLLYLPLLWQYSYHNYVFSPGFNSLPGHDWRDLILSNFLSGPLASGQMPLCNVLVRNFSEATYRLVKTPCNALKYYFPCDEGMLCSF